ncbi:GGDEF domain-containing protein [Simiduia curdlanivorans]|uniref:diguanylate cyclase n=1 Tax=Simiduia curdlanivorans TaxID=1492769 RepID=A0ABV8V6M7_9GAMM|nr:GGDEF domain-containing protein [Simiduia curdlanivorans]MDN3638866.1 GGDEF domain-containing protein [Simiduia curdlanivorans]
MTQLNDVPVAQLMSRRVICVAPEESIAVALNTLRAHKLSCLVVQTPAGLEGILTERDLVVHFDNLVSAEQLNVRNLGCVRQLMSAPAITVQEDDGLQTVLDVSVRQGIRHLPVVNTSGELVGVVTQTDLVRAYSHILERQLDLVSDNKRLMALSLIDPLMSIGNRRAMEGDLKHVQAKAQRTQSPYGLVLLDVDWFKRYNDHYGHQLGDQALRAVAKAIGDSLRQGDRLYRYGGEELILVLPDTDQAGALQAAERAREAVSQLQLEHQDSPLGHLTVSAGLASGDGDWQALVAGADSALYEAKENGRNQTRAV